MNSELKSCGHKCSKSSLTKCCECMDKRKQVHFIDKKCHYCVVCKPPNVTSYKFEDDKRRYFEYADNDSDNEVEESDNDITENRKLPETIKTYDSWIGYVISLFVIS